MGLVVIFLLFLASFSLIVAYVANVMTTVPLSARRCVVFAQVVATAFAKFLAHLVNHQVLHELAALQLLTVLLDTPTVRAPSLIYTPLS